MPEVKFTPDLKRHLTVPPREVGGQTVREALDAVFMSNPRLRGYVLDDEGRLQQHVVVFVDGTLIEDRKGLTDRLDVHSELFVMRAASGG